MKLSNDLKKIERYLATEHIINPKEVKAMMKKAIEKAKRLER